MATTFKNEFTWSYSRAQMFNLCRRAYYQKYYGSWGGWLPDHPAAKVYALKNLQNQWGWKGSVLHRVVAEYLNRVKNYGGGIKYREKTYTKPDMLDWIRDRMEQEWKISLQGETPKMRLIEHYKEHRGWGTTVELYSAIDDVQVWFSNFYHSNYHDIFIECPEVWHSVEKMAYFHISIRTPVVALRSIKVWVVLDFALQIKEVPFLIIDWKTGKRKDRDRDQLAIYALYAMECGQDIKGVRAWDIYVSEGRDCVERHRAFGTTGTAKTRTFIRRSIKDMVGVLADIKTNTPFPEDHYEMASRGSQACMFCNYKEVCPNG